MAMLTIMFRVTILFVLVLKPHVPVCQLLKSTSTEYWNWYFNYYVYMQSIHNLNRFLFLFLYFMILFFALFL